jgi:hypothetical protein
MPTSHGSLVFKGSEPKTEDSPRGSSARRRRNQSERPRRRSSAWTRPRCLAHGGTRNPWSPAHTPGAAAGGSAAAVAAGFLRDLQRPWRQHTYARFVPNLVASSRRRVASATTVSHRPQDARRDHRTDRWRSMPRRDGGAVAMGSDGSPFRRLQLRGRGKLARRRGAESGMVADLGFAAVEKRWSPSAKRPQGRLSRQQICN